MEPLGYTVEKPLNIPAELFDKQGFALVMITGASYGDGWWLLNALGIGMDGLALDEPVGSIETDKAPRQPDRALTAARVWLGEYCAGTPFGIPVFEPLNHHYGPDEAPFFTSARVVVAIPVR